MSVVRSPVASPVRSPVRAITGSGGSLTALAQILALEPTALWWPAEATMTVARDGTGAAPATGEPVGRMLDLTANAIHAIAPTDAARPLLTADGELDFDGVDDHFALSESIPITEEMTVVRAFGRSAAGIKNIGVASGVSIAPHDSIWWNDNKIYTRLSGNVQLVTSGTNTGAGSFVDTSVRNASAQTVRRNGVEILSGGSGTVSNALSALGLHATSSSNYNNGPISFLAVFDRELTGAELALVENIAAGTNGATLA